MISSFLYPFFLCYFLCLLHLCVAGFLRLPKTMVPLYVPNCFKFKLFFSFEPNVMLVSLPNVGSSPHEAFNRSQNLISSDNLETMKDGKESYYLEPLESKTKISYEKNRVFKDTWAC
ncbi:hypothetical protein BDL97_01G187600 [Sphagnum fallax]|nr:hypothetical protein BDL97_01G187600 [Sphagnum fallax]